jgi:gliding motility-associated-like protein
VIPNPTVSAFTDASINLGQSVQLLAEGDAPFLWSPTTYLSCIACESPTATPTETTVYCAEVTQNNCTSSACVTIEVENISGDLFVPDAFSPNNDGNNDCLKVFSNCLDEVLFRVYSRWGELIYESTEINGCWDGTYHGKELNSGAYAYTVKATLTDGTEVDIKGNTTLFK